MARLPIVLVHGYSDKGASFAQWRAVLEANGYSPTTIHLANYVSLSNEITIKDIAEGFDRALRERAGLSAQEPFDAIVHSTGMLVVREWLTTYAGRSERLKHLIGLAPATFGSPMAHKGRSWLGAIFKGGREPGPDFMEAGDLVLQGLELGSRYTWDLAHRDLVDQVSYGPTSRTPYPFIFIGTKDYGWLRRVVTEPGTDGTVRWAGAGFNVRKILVDLTIDPLKAAGERITLEPWRNVEVPFVMLDGLNHATILTKPSDELITMVLEALAVSSGPAYQRWRDKYQPRFPVGTGSGTRKGPPRWQQFVTRAVDERGDGIEDYFIQLGQIRQRRFAEIPFDLDVHAFREDPSYRCFHVNLDKLGMARSANLALRVIASSGTELVGYHGYHSHAETATGREEGKWDAVIEFDQSIADGEATFFYPYTTTLVEIRMNREPMPLTGVNKVFWFLDQAP